MTMPSDCARRSRACATAAPELRIADTPYLRWIASEGDGLPGGFGSIDAIAAEAASMSEDLLHAAEREVHETDQLVEIYTSGSMALPKGVKHLHGPALFRAHYLRDMIGHGPGSEVTASLPMFWVGGLMMFLMPSWTAGAHTLCADRTLSNSQMAMGTVLADEDLAVLAQSPKPWWGLGMSETLGPYSYGDEFRAPGYPVCAPLDHFADGYEVRITGEDGNAVGDGEVGELHIRGYPVTPGLHKIARDDYFTPDGYFRTGDMCLVDGTRVHFAGRGGDMIKTAGSNVSPAEVEMEMQALEGVHSAFVLGLPDQERGQLVVAAVVPREGVNSISPRSRPSCGDGCQATRCRAPMSASPAKKCRCCTRTRWPGARSRRCWHSGWGGAPRDPSRLSGQGDQPTER